MTTTTTPGFELYQAVRNAIDDHQHEHDLIQVAMLLRFKQLQEHTMHPDDSHPWRDGGEGSSMDALAELLKQRGLLVFVEAGARRLFAEVQLARTTLDATNNYSGSWGSAIATAESWSDNYRRQEEAAND